MRIQVVKGQTVRIALSSTTKSKAAAVEYVIRDFPVLGVLGTPQAAPEDRTLSTIIYQAASQSKGQLDMFSFSSRYPGGYYSAPVRVIIELSEPKAQIEVPASIDFGNVTLGDKTTREILLKNKGNIEYQKHVQLPSPFELTEPANGKLSILPGNSTILKISYRPEKVGNSNSHFAFQEKSVTTFIGNAFAPFVTTPPKLKLQWNKKNQNRLGQVQIKNQANSSISLRIRPPIRSQYLGDHSLTDSPLTIPPGESRTVTIALPREDVQGFKGSLKISTNQYVQDIPIEASASPSHIQVELPDPSLKRIDFGAANPGETISRTFMLKNLGGSGTVIGLGILPPFRIAKNQDGSQPTTYSVGPQSSAIFTINFVAPAKQFGLYSDVIEVATDVNTFSIPLTALVRDPNPTSGQTPLPPHLRNPQQKPPSPADQPLPTPAALPPLPNPEKGEDPRSPTGFYTRDFVIRKYSGSIPRASGFILHKPGRHELTLAWKLPSPDQVVFEMEMRQMLINQSNYAIESVWVPFHNIDFNRTDKMMYATVKGLQPAAIYEFRVLTVGTGGKFSLPSQPFGVQTLAPPDYRWLKWLFWILILSTIALLLRRYWNKHDGSIPMPTYWPRHIHWPFE